jgi:DNA-binding XRE family transcriptional regulator
MGMMEKAVHWRNGIRTFLQGQLRWGHIGSLPFTNLASRMAPSCLHNRVAAVMAHTVRYAFEGQARLARDCGVSRSTILRLLSGQCRPSFTLALAITLALEKQLCRRLDPRELFSFNGTYPTPSVCVLCRCRGCLPDAAYAEDGTLKPAFRSVRSGEWESVLLKQGGDAPVSGKGGKMT